MRQIDVLFLSREAEDVSLAGCTAIVIDVLRATTTIATALGNGAEAVYPVASVAEARDLATTLPRALLGGERGGIPLDGFAAGNSPLEYTAATVAARPIVITTTNGTLALARAAAAGATRIAAAALVNATAVAHWALGHMNDITLVCAGTEGRFSLEDAVGAGAIIARLTDNDANCTLSDSAHVARSLWQHYSAAPRTLFDDGEHGRRLLELGFVADLDYCAMVDVLDVVPAWAEDRLVRA